MEQLILIQDWKEALELPNIPIKGIVCTCLKQQNNQQQKQNEEKWYVNKMSYKKNVNNSQQAN